MYAAQQERPEERVLHVLDLPPIYTRPSALTLLSTLDRLKIKPFSWDVGQDQASTEGEVGRVRVDEDGVPKYLTGIISSSLLWIEDEDDRERVYESASARLAERAGRTAQPTLTRTFTIPGDPPDAPQIHICLREPSLTSDNLGHKTWLASYLLARRLPSLKHLLPSISRSSSTDPPRVLELGSGTGLLGIAAAALYPEASVHLTDLEAIVSNLEANVKANEALFSKGKSPSAGVLDWSEPSTAKTNGRFDLILASDPLYSPLHPTWLVVTILKNLNEQTTSRVIIELPLREAYVPEVEELKKRLADRRLVLLDSGEELGTEDWGDDAAHGRDKVRCCLDSIQGPAANLLELSEFNLLLGLSVATGAKPSHPQYLYVKRNTRHANLHPPRMKCRDNLRSIQSVCCHHSDAAVFSTIAPNMGTTMHHPRALLSLILSFLLLLTLVSSPITAITIPPPHSPPPDPSSALTPRAQHTLRNGYTLHFTTSTAIMPIQISATALSLWYSSIWRRMNTRPSSPSTAQVFKQAFAYKTKHLSLTFSPQLPASNLAVKSMAMAFMEWIEARARQGFSEMYEATMNGPWGTIGIKMEWIGP